MATDLWGEWREDPGLWEQHVRAAEIPGPICILDLNPSNILQFSLGTVSSLAPLRRDMETVLASRPGLVSSVLPPPKLHSFISIVALRS